MKPFVYHLFFLTVLSVIAIYMLTKHDSYANSETRQAEASTPSDVPLPSPSPKHAEATGKATQPKAGDKEILTTWGLFIKGCISQSTQLERWADKQIALKKADMKKVKGFPGRWKNLGYPLPDKLKNMWGVMGAPIFIYEHEHNGCTITSSADIGPNKLETYFKELGKMAEKDGGVPTTLKVIKNKKTNSSILLLSFNRPVNKSNATAYILARSFPGDKNKVKTILHYFRTSETVKL